MLLSIQGKRDFADGITLRILGWEDYSELSGWAEYNYKGSYKFKREPEKAHVMTEAEVGVTPLLTMRKGP